MGEVGSIATTTSSMVTTSTRCAEAKLKTEDGGGDLVGAGLFGLWAFFFREVFGVPCRPLSTFFFLWSVVRSF
ncbi:hypothetical protein GUJ93_ZPchr0012g19144 [Zizania palustris]|uniref:Uncharacterized protein n=1 Tax=Zizania palustris TaxID=103762 RepID=A0A8J5WKU3_ZIZPA|nr:hypothetical protein GUJ93_ZPchr0012g19144 [Zizania palustris]